MITPEPPAGSEHYREGWRHGYEQAAIDRERSTDAVRLGTGQREALATVRAIWGQGAPEAKAALREQPPRWPQLCAALDVLAGAVPDTGQARERSLDLVVLRLLARQWRSGHLREAGLRLDAYLDQFDGDSSGDTVQTPDVTALAYARSEVDKWLDDGDPYCILPTRTEHIPALLARLDELEGTR